MSKTTLTTGLIDKLPAFGRLDKFKTRREWLDGRRGWITASKASALFGMNDKYESLYTLWASESGSARDQVDEAESTFKQEWGIEMEPAVLRGLAKKQKWQVEAWPQTWSIRHPDAKLRLSATPDGLAIPTADFDGPWFDGELISVQVKTADEFYFRQWDRDDDDSVIFPPHYQIQTQVELDCLGLNHGVLAVLIGTKEVRLLPYSRNEAFLARLHEFCQRFWELVDSGEEPEVDGSEATANYIKKRYASEDGSAVNLPAEIDIAARELAEAKATIKAAEVIKNTRESQIKKAIGNATFGVTPDGVSFSWKEQTRFGVDSAKLKHLFPEAAEECEKISRFRVLRECKEPSRELFR